MSVVVKVIKSDSEHDNQKWLVLEASIPGVPAVTKRRAINTALIVSNPGALEAEKAKLIADVEEYHARHLAVQLALRNL